MGKPNIALAQQDQIYCDILDPLGRLRSRLFWNMTHIMRDVENETVFIQEHILYILDNVYFSAHRTQPH